MNRTTTRFGAAAALLLGLLTTTSTRAPAASATTTPPTKVLVVVEENHTQTEALNGMPYLRSLSSTYGRTSSYHGVTHPSLPNYLAIAGGSTFGVHDDYPPSYHKLTGASVFGQALAHARTAKTYAEAMSSACQQYAYGRYAVKHNPWAYFVDSTERSGCLKDDVPSGTLSSGALRSDSDAGRLPNVGLVVPDLCHDGHDCSLSTADSWLKYWVPVLQKSPDYTAGRLAIVVTFDEDDSSTSSNLVLTVVVHPSLHGTVVSTSLNHYSLSRWLSEVAGATPLRSAAYATSLGKAFGLHS